MSEINPQATVKCKVSMSGQVIRGPQSEYGPPGQTEDLDFGENTTQVVELTHEDAVKLLGQERADELFRGASSEGGEYVE